jgi:hypothetical protein
VNRHNTSLIELVYLPDCPNVSILRDRLRIALEALDMTPNWSEVDISSDKGPYNARRYPSPSILINGRDLMGSVPEEGYSCRIYSGSQNSGLLSVEAIIKGLRASSTPLPGRNDRIVSSLITAPAAILSILPVLSCPSCWPAYATMLSSIGLPFLMNAAWLFPITAVSLAVALGGLAFRARQRHGFGPLFLGLLAVGAILAGKFVFESNWVAYAGTSLLLGAGFWSGRPRKFC